jgi:mRNA interferase RelE/StbE
VASYSVLIKPSAVKELETVPRKDRARIVSKIQALGGVPRPAGCEKLSGQEQYRLRQGRYRIVYSVSVGPGGQDALGELRQVSSPGEDRFLHGLQCGRQRNLLAAIFLDAQIDGGQRFLSRPDALEGLFLVQPEQRAQHLPGPFPGE